jgi:hypothetical protein
MNKKMEAIVISAITVLIFSSLMDAYLWFTKRFMVPSIVVSGMSLGSALMLYVILKEAD